ncbi:MAG: hypothetical protein CMJ59_21610 [Planctomycetaceae bacterium]|nr:hypothetical protein [Planctomycetaceae bacterium]
MTHVSEEITTIAGRTIDAVALGIVDLALFGNHLVSFRRWRLSTDLIWNPRGPAFAGQST